MVILGIYKTESNRPATNFPGISVDPNQFDCLDEKSGLRCLASTITKAYGIRLIPISRCSAGVAHCVWNTECNPRVLNYDSCGGSVPIYLTRDGRTVLMLVSDTARRRFFRYLNVQPVQLPNVMDSGPERLQCQI